MPKRYNRVKAGERVTTILFPLLTLVLLFTLQLIWRNNCGYCFSDVKMFYGQRFLDGTHQFPYLPFQAVSGLKPIDHAIEYPVLTGFVMWAYSFLVPSYDIYRLANDESFRPEIIYANINSIFSLILLIIAAIIIWKLTNSRFVWFFTLTPTLYFSSLTNFDMWAVTSSLVSLYFLKNSRWKLGACFLAASISFKFYPIFIFFLLLIAVWKKLGMKIATSLR